MSLVSGGVCRNAIVLVSILVHLCAFVICIFLPALVVADTPTTVTLTVSDESPYDITFQFSYRPPLSVSEAINLTYRVRRLLDPEDKKFIEPRREKAIEALGIIIDYIKFIDDRHSSLPYYKWYKIGENEVSLGGIDEDTFKVRPPLKNVSAISFVALYGDVFVHNIRVLDENRSETKFNVNRWIKLNFPRKEVCFLYFPTNVERIIITYSARKEAVLPPKLIIYGGITSLPEYGKAALYYLTRAQQALKNNVPFHQITDDLQKAIHFLIRFKNSRQI